MPESGFPYRRLVAWVARRHRAILIGSLALFVLSALSLLRLRLDMDLLAQLPSHSKVFTDYREYLQDFGAFDSLILLVRGARIDIVPFADALATELGKVPEIASVRYRVDLDAVRSRFLEPHREQLLAEEDAAELARRLEPTAIAERVHGLKRALAAPMSFGARQWIAKDPLGIDEIVGRSFERRYADAMIRPSGEYFLSRGGDSLLMIVRPRESAFDTIFSERLLENVHAAERRLLDGEWRGRSVEVAHTGSYVYAVADKQIMRDDLRIYFVIAPLAVLAIFHLGLRSLRILPFVTLPLVLTTIAMFAVSLLWYGSLTMISVASAAIFYGLGIDSSIYFYHLLREKAAELDQPLDAARVEQAVADTLVEIGAATVVASTTTAIAFLVIGYSDFTGVSQLGVMTAIGMLLNIPATFILLPAMVFAWGPRAIPSPARESRIAEGFGRFAEWIAAHRAGVSLALLLLLSAVAAAGLPRLSLDTDFAHLRMGGGEAERVEQRLRAEYGAVDAQGIVVVRAEDTEAALVATERVTAVLERYRTEGVVRSISSLTTFFPSAKTASERLSRFRALPRAAAARALEHALEREGFDTAAFRGVLADLERDDRREISIEEQRDGPLAGLIEHHFRRDAESAAIATYLVPSDGASLASLQARLHADLPDVRFAFTGRPLVERELASLLRGELGWFIGASIGLNLLLVLFAERRLSSSLALLSPTIAALILYLGLMGLLGVAIDPINLIVLPLLIGLGVDDGVYLTAHARFAGSLATGVRRGAIALLLAAGTTIVGFGSLGLSRYPALVRLGLLGALGLGLCTIAALFAVPLLARTLGVPTSRSRAQESPST